MRAKVMILLSSVELIKTKTGELRSIYNCTTCFFDKNAARLHKRTYLPNVSMITGADNRRTNSEQLPYSACVLLFQKIPQQEGTFLSS